MTPEEEFAALAAYDQTAAALGDLSTLLATYLAQLVLRGFTREEAFELVCDYHAELLAHHLSDGEDGE